MERHQMSLNKFNSCKTSRANLKEEVWVNEENGMNVENLQYCKLIFGVPLKCQKMCWTFHGIRPAVEGGSNTRRAGKGIPDREQHGQRP